MSSLAQVHPSEVPQSSRTTLQYFLHTPDPSVTCPICHDPVIANAVVFSCHPLVLHCADCVTMWVVRMRQVNTHAPLSCPHCRNRVSLRNFVDHPGRWEEERGDVAMLMEGVADESEDSEWEDEYDEEDFEAEDDEEDEDEEEEYDDGEDDEMMEVDQHVSWRTDGGWGTWLGVAKLI